MNLPKIHLKLDAKHVVQFRSSGYLLIKNAIAPDLLTQLKQYSDDIQTAAFYSMKNGHKHDDFAFSCHNLIPFLNRIDNFHYHAQLESLRLLGSPLIQAIANSLCSINHICSVDMMILKNKGDDLDLPWHQDVIFEPPHKVIAIGIYLEDSKVNDGALQLILDSQHRQHHIPTITDNNQQFKWIELAANAGDILIHNPMIVHRSLRLTQQPFRRTLYYEFRDLAQALQQNWPSSVIKQRQILENKAINYYRTKESIEDIASCYQDKIPLKMVNI